MRPTGKLHLGNYMGALANWVKLQDQYDCYFFIADLHALTTDYADTSNIVPNTLEVALDFLAAGLDPERSTIFVQSHVKQHFQLPMYLGMITPLGWLERVPSYKEMQENLATKDLTTYGFLGYPVLMASDILLYQPDFVPVGQDQQAHVEITREIARRFNQFYPRRGSRTIGEPLKTTSAALRQYDPDDRSRAGGPPEAQDHGYRPGAHSPHRPWRPRQVSRRRSAQSFFDPGNTRQSLRRLPLGRNRLHRVQGLGRRSTRPDPGATADPPCQLFGAASQRNPQGRLHSRERPRRADHGRSARSHAVDIGQPPDGQLNRSRTVLRFGYAL
jgi:tryptophanyl-tRNA synthetase